MLRMLASASVGVVCWVASMAAQAALPTVSMSFDQQSGTAGASDEIEVWITLTVDAGSAPLVFDANTPAPFGFAAADLPVQGNYNDSATYGTAPADFASYTYVQTNTAYGCTGTFTNSCGAGAYQFNFHTTSEPGRPTFNFLPSLNLQPGDSFSYLFGSFTPVGGVAPAGTYTFFSAYTDLVFSGLDANGHDLYAYVDLGKTCVAGETADCAFTRTVTDVPEPQSWILMGLGLIGIGAIARRRRND